MTTPLIKGISNLFRDSKFTIVKHRHPISDLMEDLAGNRLNALKVVPFEAVSAINKIAQGNIKEFVETHIEPHICTNISTLCRGYPLRIKYSIYIDKESVSIYSECIDLEVLLALIFGDFVKYMEFIKGYRDNILFKHSIIPQNLLSGEVRDFLVNIVGYVGFKTSSRSFRDIVNELISRKNEVNELILVLPCIDPTTIEFISYIARELLKNPLMRLFVVTSVPSVYDARTCGVSYNEFFTGYVEALDIFEDLDRLYFCSSEASAVEIIINRATYLASYDARLRHSTELVPVKNFTLVDGYILKYLRDCICSLHLVKRR
uniref:Uncharacterized protein n=1 Tax=Ignisphaera aggregans TaxID=334771 RepID=A0A7C2VNY4_9CREN